MPFPIESKLVVAVSATALFDLSREHDVYVTEGLEAYRHYVAGLRHETPNCGTAFPFVKRLLHLNVVYEQQAPVEVVLLTRHHADVSLRIMDAISYYGLSISRANFLGGRLPYPYMKSYDAVLYLSTNRDEVRQAVEQKYPAGLVLPCPSPREDAVGELRIAFDFDGVLVDDEAERVYQDSGQLDIFHEHELSRRSEPLNSGPLMPLLEKLSAIQAMEREMVGHDPAHKPVISTSIVTARNAPAHERLISTLASYGIEVDQLFLLGGIEKRRVLDVLNPHIYFDDQVGHLETVSSTTPSVHIPFGVTNL